MEEEINSELREKIQKNVDRIFEKWLAKASKSESIEGIIKSLMVEKIMNVLGAIMKRTVVKKVAKKAVKRAVDKYWEKNRLAILEKIKNL
ncbi:MAG: hypothetical protein JSV62_16040 [Promethearchaeota archaeon]|nr:MAG: hypothetical protein JSV62_16040 [Candidatus Lokiarchaeota archaeon]